MSTNKNENERINFKPVSTKHTSAPANRVSYLNKFRNRVVNNRGPMSIRVQQCVRDVANYTYTAI